MRKENKTDMKVRMEMVRRLKKLAEEDPGLAQMIREQDEDAVASEEFAKEKARRSSAGPKENQMLPTAKYSVFAEIIGSYIDPLPEAKEAPDHSTNRKRRKCSQLSIQQRFDIFHTDNPWVYDLLVGGAYEAIGEGHKHFGVSFIWERIRWQFPLKTEGRYGADYKMNNDFRSRYVRLIEDREPGLRGFFKTRSLRSL